ncbi:succinylglutamate desuccinylase/aspartoacylase family protein [Qipengyuania sp. MTN3-11]|uniref:succinylglutamate desuccinylase/aspartoacylase family protein n=1 Tax=Qipengyuania sp. MTN3-11 TaxID=3056557 RepID=UPI0036F1F50B
MGDNSTESPDGHGAFEIAGESIPPGERRTLAIPVTHQVTGFPANLALQVIHGKEPGPAVFVSAAIHGDEIVGTAIIQRLVARITPDDLKGTLILCPAVNIFGFMQHMRYLPDRRDLNRSFPGSQRGSLAAQLAHCFLEHVIDRCSLGIDLHTAAINRYNLPQIRIASGSPYLVELAMAFGAPVIIESPLRPGSMRALAAEREVPMLLMEAGEALRFDRLSIDIGTSGICRVLAHIGMIDADDGLTSVGIPARANRSSWVRAPRGGVTHRVRKSGDIVYKGDLLATVTGLFGEDGQEMLASVDGIIIGHATLPVVNQGDAVFHIAQLEHPERAGDRIDTITEAIMASEPAGTAQPMMDEDEVL